MLTTAFWISPENRYLWVNRNHISTVISDPAMFGLDRETIESTYEAFQEKIPQEGLARRELILQIVGRGKGDGVDKEVNFAKRGGCFGEHFVNRCIIGDVTFLDKGAVDALGQGCNPFLQNLAGIAKPDGCTSGM